MNGLVTTTAPCELFVPANDTQLACQHTILMCGTYGAIHDKSGVMTLRPEHFEPKAWDLPRVPGEALISFAVDSGRVAFHAHDRRITVDDVEVQPQEYGYIDLDGVASLAKPKQITIHCGDVLRHIVVSCRHVHEDGTRTDNVWKLILHEEKLSLKRLFA